MSIDKDKKPGPNAVERDKDKTELYTELRTEITPASEPIDSQEISVGYILKDRFVLDAKLGEGAMGVVYRARDMRKVEVGDANPYMAVKIIVGQFNQDPRAFIALQRETKKSQTLSHPNIITVYDFDRDGDTFFMTMEALVGKTLSDYIKQDQGKNRAEALRIIEEIAKGIAYAHKRLIVHSDLKPQNIFITSKNEVKILDFGIARAYSSLKDDDEATRAITEVVGMTPAYASYEMFAGDEPHPSDDVYALGVIAYELLSGKHPFSRKNAIKVRQAKLSPKKIKGLKSYQWQAIQKALSIDRSDRWQQADSYVRKFTGVGRSVRMLAVGLAVSLYILAAFLYFYEPDSGPEISFEKLAMPLQEKISKHLKEGRLALEFKDYNGAIFSFDQAYSLHPRNEQAVKELSNIVDDVLKIMKSDQTQIKLSEHYAEIGELLKYESLSQNKTLVDEKSRLEKLLAKKQIIESK